jgi:hypothetical protein
MRNHMSVHLATTKYFPISFILKKKIEKEGLPKDSPAGLGAGGPLFQASMNDVVGLQTDRSFYSSCNNRSLGLARI